MDKNSLSSSASRTLSRIPFSWHQVLIVSILALVGFIGGYDFFHPGSLPVLAKAPLNLTGTNIQWLLLGPATTAGLSLETAVANKFLFRTSEAKAALGIGNTRLYELINNGTLDPVG